MNCGFLSPPENGEVVHTGTTFDETAEFSCNTGYELSDSATQRCLANAMWSDISPTCIRMSSDMAKICSVVKHVIGFCSCKNIIQDWAGVGGGGRGGGEGRINYSI